MTALLAPAAYAAQFLSVSDVADLFSIHPNTVRILLTTGQLRGLKVGHQWRIPASAIEELNTGGTALDASVVHDEPA